MILINTKTPSTSSLKQTDKSSSKKKNIKFSTKQKEQSLCPTNVVSNIVDISRMLFLQEIENEHAEVQEFGQDAIKVLKNLQMKLLQGNIEEQNLYQLKNILKNKNFTIKTPEILSIVQEIDTRIQVEIAKIESNLILK
jgi:hypothetical protein